MPTQFERIPRTKAQQLSGMAGYTPLKVSDVKGLIHVSYIARQTRVNAERMSADTMVLVIVQFKPQGWYDQGVGYFFAKWKDRGAYYEKRAKRENPEDDTASFLPVPIGSKNVFDEWFKSFSEVYMPLLNE